MSLFFERAFIVICILSGNLTVRQLFASLPSEQVAIANASGTTVIQLFARAVQDITVDAAASATFLQVSGRYYFKGGIFRYGCHRQLHPIRLLGVI